MLKRVLLRWAAALAVVVTFSDNSPVQAGKTPPPPVYTHRLCWLGTGEFVFQSWGRGVNTQGDVVGHAYWHTDDQGGWIGEAYICWNAPSRTIVNLNEVVDVPYPDAYLYDAYDINDKRQIVGVLSWNGTYAYPFRYTPNLDGIGGELEVLGTVGEAPDLSIDQYTRINQNGDMLVYSDTYQTPCIYTYATAPDGRDLKQIPRKDGYKLGFRDMNSAQQVAGFFPPGLVPHTPVRYNGPDLGTFTTFGWLKSPGKSPSGMAQGINENGVVTGYMLTLGGGVTHAFRYSDAKGLEDLGGLGDMSTNGQSINGAGVVVGDATGVGQLNTAFVRVDGRGMFDLKKSTKDLPAEAPQWGMTARRINERGWILGKIGPYAYLLEPLP